MDSVVEKAKNIFTKNDATFILDSELTVSVKGELISFLEFKN